MAIEYINTGNVANDGTGDSLRVSFTKTNNTFSYLGSIISGEGNLTANNLSVSGNVLLGQTLTFSPEGAAMQYGGNANAYVQMVMQNKNSLTNASTDFVATADNGNDSSYYVDLGIASSGYYYEGFDSIQPNDSYLIANGGNLLINAGSADKNIKFIVGGSNVSHIVGNINSTSVVFTQTTPSDSTESGAFQIAGGAGIMGNIYVGGNVSSNGNISSAGGIVAANGVIISSNLSADTTFINGIAVDYFENTARINFGSIDDGLAIFNDGIANNQILNLTNIGDLTIAGNLTTISGITAGGNLTVTGANRYFGTNINIDKVFGISYNAYNGTQSNVTSIFSNIRLGHQSRVLYNIESNVTVNFFGDITPGVEKVIYIKNVNQISTANIILPNANNNKASNVAIVQPSAVATIKFFAVDDTEANVIATITNN